MKYTFTLLLTIIIATSFAQCVPEKTKADLKHKRFLEAAAKQYKQDSIWFYSRITEEYVTKGKDTTWYVLHTPLLLVEHSFEKLFDSSVTVVTNVDSNINTFNFFDSSNYQLREIPDSSGVPGASYLTNVYQRKHINIYDTTFIYEGGEPDKIQVYKNGKKSGPVKKHKKPRYSKIKGKGERYAPFVKFIGTYGQKEAIQVEYMNDTLPTTVKPDNTSYFIIRADNNSLVRIFNLIKFTNQ